MQVFDAYGQAIVVRGITPDEHAEINHLYVPFLQSPNVHQQLVYAHLFDCPLHPSDGLRFTVHRFDFNLDDNADSFGAITIAVDSVSNPSIQS